MKPFPNVLRVVLTDIPTEFDGMTDLRPMLQEGEDSIPGVRDGERNLVFETRYAYEPRFRGPALKKEKDGRPFVYIGWFGTRDGERIRFRRLKVHLDRVNIAWDCEVVVAGRGKDGSPACATATLLSARNVEDYLPEVEG